MSKREWRFFLKDIKESIDKIIKYTKDMDKNQFLLDDKTFDAVMRNLQIIGEAVRGENWCQAKFSQVLDILGHHWASLRSHPFILFQFFELDLVQMAPVEIGKNHEPCNSFIDRLVGGQYR
jgi:uncharacterized protein with HEPN domain